MPNQNKKVLVAGASGYLGGFVTREFKARGYYVRALTRSPEKLDALKDHLDEIVVAEVTQPETLENVCEGIEVVFSSIGITRQKDKLHFHDVDYQGNKNLLGVAKRAGVKKFIYVSVFEGSKLTHLEIVKAHEHFVEDLKASGLAYSVIRPTGFFSDMEEFYHMAKKGRVYLIGSGNKKTNPIHGADLAVVCVNAVDESRQEINVGGPEIMTYREVAKLAFEVLGQPVKIQPIPNRLMKMIIDVTKIFTHHTGELLAFFSEMAGRDMVAPATGTHTLKAHFEQCRDTGKSRHEEGFF